MKDLVSIIVPVYNVEKYLKRSINSIVSQSYTNLEIILVDDGSKDSSGIICDEIARKDVRIKVIHTENGGLSRARNIGMENASGDFYSFIDSDDVIHKDFVYSLMDIQKKYSADIAACNLINFNEDSEIKVEEKTNPYEVALTSKEALREYFHPKEKRIIHHGLCMKLYKKELFQDIRFDEGKLHEDLYITYKLLDACNTFAFIDLPYYFYFQGNNESICNNYREKNFIDETNAYFSMYSYFNNDETVINELISFILVQLRHAIYKGRKINNNSNIRSVKKNIIKWVDENVGRCIYYSLIKKIWFMLSVRFIWMYKIMIGLRT